MGLAAGLPLLLCGAGAMADTVRFSTPKPVAAISVQKAETHGPDTPESWRGKVVVLHFWATWCTPCVEEMPDMNRLAKRYAGNRDVLIVPVSQDMTGFLTIKTFYRRHELSALPMYWDEKAAAFKALGLNALPTTLILDRDGRVTAQIRGQADWDENGEGEIATLIEEALGQP